AFGAARLPKTGGSRRLSRNEDGAIRCRATEPAGLEAAGQGTSQPHRRLQLRRGGGPVCRTEHSTQEVLCQRLLLSDTADSSATAAGRLDQTALARAAAPRTVLLSRLSSDSSSRPGFGIGEPLHPLPW